ncbi:hypothetical protein LEP1GSC052_1393 [Leptospira kmetyi serovar Malaysia str. Bejo-Iso9]|nr:hypothetical protein LEP1GSC052_1393 [Leptospira kmetyi serovar Malaysia str. Bejo-Iso9]
MGTLTRNVNSKIFPTKIVGTHTKSKTTTQSLLLCSTISVI